MNLVILTGRIAADLVIRYMPNGIAVLNFPLATDESYWHDTKKVEAVEFHSMVAYDKVAERIVKHFQKGYPITIKNGRLKTRKYKHKNTDIDIYKTEIIIEDFEFSIERPRGVGVAENTETPAGVSGNKAAPPAPDHSYDRGEAPS